MKKLGLKDSFMRLWRPAPEPARRWLRRALFVLAAVVITPTFVINDAIGQAHVPRGGSVGIQNDTERELFGNLICMCGCPRETLRTCTCDYASSRRDELREMLAQGMSLQAVQKAYASRFGTKSLAVPTNEGMGPLIWAFPLVAFIFGAFMVVRLLRKWARRGEVARIAQSEAAPAPAGRDEYDEKLDDALKDLDR